VSGSIWKKEIALRRKHGEPAAEAQPGLAPEVEHEPAVEAVAMPELAPERDPEPVPEVGPLPAPSGDYGWLTTSFDPADVPEQMPVVAPPPVAPPVPEPVPLPSLPAVEVAEVAAPVVAAAEAVAAIPFWKREVSFSRKPKAPKQPKAAKQPKQAKEPQADNEEQLPFWKREVSFSRKPKEPKAAKEPKAPKEPKAAEEEQLPFWKREVSFSRKPKEPKAAKEPNAPKEPKTAKEEQPPFWKREVSFSRKPKEPNVAKEPKEPKAAKGKQPPIWKRELAFSKPKGGEKAPKQHKQKGGAHVHGPTVGKSAMVGLKIGASQIVAARVSNGGSPHLLQVARAPLPEGVVVAGELRDIEALSKALKELFAKHKLPKRGVRLGIANSRIGVRTFEIAGIDDPRQLANAIRFRAQETLPIPLEEAVLDWQILSERQDGEGGPTIRRVLLVVAYRELVDKYVLACRKAGIRLAGIDLEAFAMQRALTTPLADDAPAPSGVQVLVNIGHDRSTCAVSDGRHCEFTRVLGWGGLSLSVAIARALDITPEEAQPIKHAVSLVATAVQPEGFDPATLDTAREAVRNELQAFARELVSSLRFYQNQPGSLGIGEVVLTGGTSHLPGFVDELHRLIGVTVQLGDPLNRVVLPKKFHEPDDYSVGSLTVAIGLGIED
jgi:type IV pilus assembly protein PilM